MEADKRVNEIDWSWAVSQINKVVNEALLKLEENDTMEPDDKKQRLNEIEKAWQRILSG